MPRRRAREPYGYGSWTTLPSGAVRFSITIGGRRTGCTGPTKRALEREVARLQEWKMRVEHGTAQPPPRLTDVTYAALEPHLQQRYATGGTRRGRRGRPYSPATLENYRLLLRQVLEWWGPRLVVGTTVTDVEEYVLRLQKEGYSANSIRHRLDRVSELMDVAVRIGWIIARPCPVERPAPDERTLPEAIAETRYEELLTAARALEDPRPLLVCLLAGDAGLRRAEIAHLRGQEVVLRKWDGASHGYIVVANDGERRTKSGRGRTVPIFTARLAAALRAADADDGQPVVQGAETVVQVYALACEAWRAAWPETTHAVKRGAGTRDRGGARLHTLRHRFGTTLAEAGIPLKILKELMGHSTILTTEKYLRRRFQGTPPGAAAALSGPTCTQTAHVAHGRRSRKRKQVPSAQ